MKVRVSHELLGTIYGELDGMVTVAHGEWLHARLPASDLTVVPGAGHGQTTFGEADRNFAWLVS